MKVYKETYHRGVNMETYLDKIIPLINEGKSTDQICMLLNLTTSTFRNWAKTKPDINNKLLENGRIRKATQYDRCRNT